MSPSVLQPDPEEIAIAAEGAGAETFRGFVLQKALARLRDSKKPGDLRFMEILLVGTDY